MGMLSRMRKQNAIYWPPDKADDDGRMTHGELCELTLSAGVNSRVRWEDKAQEFTDARGSTQMSSALVYVPILPDGSEIVPGGFIWLGNRADLTSEDDPAKNDGAWLIRAMHKLPTLKATDFLRSVFL